MDNFTPLHPWARYVALGDSFTEGIGDPEASSPGGHRGWADRVAEELSRGHENFEYANLAIRGKLLAQILSEQLEPALALQADLISISAGGNDLLRPSADPDALAQQLDTAVGRMRAAGASVVILTGPDVRAIPVLARIRGRIAIYNENIRTVAAHHDVMVANMWSLRQLTDHRMWDEDRLHFSPLGHHTIATMVLETLGVPHTLLPMEPTPLPQQRWQAARAGDLVWAREFFFPWVLRRLRHQSLGDGVSAKRPTPGPMDGPMDGPNRSTSPTRRIQAPVSEHPPSINTSSPSGARTLKATGLLASLGADIPLVAAPMAGGPSTPALVLAAAAAGGLGFLAGGYQTPQQLAGQIAQVRTGLASVGATAFGVNVFAPNPVPIARQTYASYRQVLHDLATSYGVSLPEMNPREDDDGWADKVELLTDDPVPVVSFTFGLPDLETVRRLHRAGSQVIQTVTNQQEAQQAAALGVDGLVVQSFEAGGHSGTLSPTTPVPHIPLPKLVHLVHSRVPLPLWAAGGISTPATVQAALAHGAEAAVVGSVLLRTPESGAAKSHKDALAQHRTAVLTTAFSGRPARALRNAFTDRFDAVAPLGYPSLHHLTSPLRKAAAAAHDAENMSLWAGAGYLDASEEAAATLLRYLATSSLSS